MANQVIENYISANYPIWIKRTRRLCYLYSVGASEAEDVLQDVMYIIFRQRTESAVLEMISIIVHNHYTMLEIFISRTLRNKLANVRSRKLVRDRAIIPDLDLGRLNVVDAEYIPPYDVYEQQRRLAGIVEHLQIDEKIKSSLNNRLVYNNPHRTLRGDHYDLTERYRVGLQALTKVLGTQAQM